jgi:hypothetical protein
MLGKRFLLIGVVLTVLPASAQAQFGIRGGVNLSKFVGVDAATVESRKGINLGMSIPIISIGPVSIVPEVYYSQKGAKQTALVGVPAFAFDVDYIEVPLLAKLTIPLNSSRSIRAYLAGGPAYAWNINCSFSSTEMSEVTENSCGETFGSFDTAMDKADRGIVVSTGLDFSVPGLGGLNLDARFIKGLARLREGEDGSDIKNQAFSVMLGYYLGR